MLEVDSIADIFMNLKDGPSLVSALKQCLVGKEELLSIAAVQNVTLLLTKDKGRQYAVLMLQQDVAGTLI